MFVIKHLKLLAVKVDHSKTTGVMDDQPLPDWLTNEFLTQCLQKEEGKQDIVVTNHIASPVAPPGNNYGSFIIRLKIEYKHNSDDSELNSLSLILKSELTHGAVKEAFDCLGDLQQSEYDFYYSFLPKAGKITDIEFAPKSFFSSTSSVTILEDLKEKGFLLADRTKQLDFDHCRLYMEAAAAMHAASFAIHKEDPNLIESICKGEMFSEMKGHEMFISMINGGMEVLANTTKKIEGFKKYAEVIREVTPLMWNTLVEIHKPSIGIDTINTINQGDPWTANMMFRYDEMGNVCEVKLIDFQCLRYSSPFNDLVFFIWSSANNYVKSHKLDELYKIYLEAFNSKLKQLNCAERLTYEHLNKCVKKLSPLACFQVASMFPLLTHQDTIDFGKFLPDDSENQEEIVLNYYKYYYNENYCREQVPISLKQLEKVGVFADLKRLIKRK